MTFPRCIPPRHLTNTPTCTARRLNHPEEPMNKTKAKNAAWIIAGSVTALTAVIVVADQLNQLNGKIWW